MKPIRCMLGRHRLHTMHSSMKERARSNRKGGNHNRYTYGKWIVTHTYCECCDYEKISYKFRYKR